MFFVNEIETAAPAAFKTALQEKTYRALEALRIPFERVDTDEAITMEDCIRIDAKLHMRMVKTLFLCNRRQTAFYLFVTAGDKPFRAKEFGNALGAARVSFAPAERMEEMLGTKIGAATIFSALLDTEGLVQIVFDRDVVQEKWYGCSDGTTTGYMKLATEHILHKLLPFAKHTPTIITI